MDGAPDVRATAAPAATCAISSGAGIGRLGSGVSAYAAGKGGGISFMRHLALETAQFNYG